MLLITVRISLNLARKAFDNRETRQTTGFHFRCSSAFLFLKGLHVTTALSNYSARISQLALSHWWLARTSHRDSRPLKTLVHSLFSVLRRSYSGWASHFLLWRNYCVSSNRPAQLVSLCELSCISHRSDLILRTDLLQSSLCFSFESLLPTLLACFTSLYYILWKSFARSVISVTAAYHVSAGFEDASADIYHTSSHPHMGKWYKNVA